VSGGDGGHQRSDAPTLPPSGAAGLTYSQRLPESVAAEVERTTWLDFASILLVLVGALNIIDGIAAIHGSSSYVLDRVLFANLGAWGWLMLVWGILQIVAATAVYRGATWGAAVALATAFGNAIVHLSSVATNPIWSLTIMSLDVLLIYGLVARAGLRQRAR